MSTVVKTSLSGLDILAVIASEQYHLFPDSNLTVCALTLKNGFVVTGESSCVSKKNFNSIVGEQLARDQAVDKVWMLEGYLLKQKLYEIEQRD